MSLVRPVGAGGRVMGNDTEGPAHARCKDDKRRSIAKPVLSVIPPQEP